MESLQGGVEAIALESRFVAAFPPAMETTVSSDCLDARPSNRAQSVVAKSSLECISIVVTFE